METIQTRALKILILKSINQKWTILKFKKKRIRRRKTRSQVTKRRSQVILQIESLIKDKTLMLIKYRNSL